MKQKIDGSRVKTLRDSLGWTQDRLADETTEALRRKTAEKAVHSQTISKIERGDTTSTSPKTLRALAVALHVDSLVLTGEAPMPDEKSRERHYVTDRLTLSRQQWQAVSAVALRYRVKEDTIFEWAPVLFAIFAQQSLAQRRSVLGALTAKQEALRLAGSKAPHLGWRPWQPHDSDDEMVDAERRSIEAYDIFASLVIEKIPENDDDPTDPDNADCIANPFVAFVREAGRNVGLEVHRPSWPGDTLCLELFEGQWFDAVTGGDEALNVALMSQWLLLRDIPRDLMPRNRLADRQAWLRDQLQADPHAAEEKHFFDEVAVQISASLEAQQHADVLAAQAEDSAVSGMKEASDV